MKRYLREQFMRNLPKFVVGLLFLAWAHPGYPFPTAPSGGFGASPVSSGPGRSTASGNITPQNHSARYADCETFANKHFKDFHGENGGGFLTVNEATLSSTDSEFYKELVKISGVDTSSAATSRAGDVNEEQARRIAGFLDMLVLCDAASFAFTLDNYTSDEFEMGSDGNSGETTSAMNAGAMQCLGQQGQQQQQQCMAQQQGSGQEITCKHFGPETHDYMACKRIVTFLDGFVIGRQVMGVQQQFRVGSSAIDAQSDLARKAREEGGLRITDGMEVQRDSLEQQGNMAYEMAAFDAARAGTLMAMISSFPRPQKMIDTCTENFSARVSAAQGSINNIALKIAEGINSTNSSGVFEKIKAESQVMTSPPPVDEICNRVVASQFGPTKLFVNQRMIETVRGIAVQAGLEALANGAKGALLHDQANMVEDAMKDIKEFEPPEFPVAEFPEETASECLVDPNAEGCIAPVAAGFDGFRSGGFNATIGGSANLGDNTLSGDLEDESSGTSASAKRDLIPDSFGVVEAGGSSDNSFADGAAGAGSIKAGQAGAGGGGGGGAPAGGGGAFGGGGSANKAAAAKKPSGIKNINIKTKGDGLGVVGGRGRIGATKAKAENPFAKLLGKDSAGNKTLNFRGPAQVGDKKGSIFQMISNRYSVVQKKDRLLKYEAKE